MRSSVDFPVPLIPTMPTFVALLHTEGSIVKNQFIAEQFADVFDVDDIHLHSSATVWLMTFPSALPFISAIIGLHDGTFALGCQNVCEFLLDVGFDFVCTHLFRCILADDVIAELILCF